MIKTINKIVMNSEKRNVKDDKTFKIDIFNNIYNCMILIFS